MANESITNNSMRKTMNWRRAITISGFMLSPQSSAVEILIKCSNGSRELEYYSMVGLYYACISLNIAKF